MFVSVFSFTSYSSFSQEIGLPFIRNYSPHEYQSHRQNWAIVQARDGLMYFANGKGVLEFDGVNWRLIMLPNHGHVRSLAIGNDGTIYVGGNGDFGYLSPDHKGLFQFTSLLSHVPENARGFGRIWTIVETNQGIFFQAYNHLFRLKDGKIKTWHFGTRLHRVFAFGDVVYGADMDLGLLRLKDDKFKPVPGGSKVKTYRVDIMLPGERDEFLLGTRHNGLFIFDNNTIVPHEAPANDTLRSLGIYKAVYLPDGNIAIASNFGGGIIIVDKKSWKIRRVINEASGIANNNVLNLFVDRQNALWIGMQEGISRVELDPVFSVFDKRLGLNGTVQDVIRHKGTVFAATSNGLSKLIKSIDGENVFSPVQGIPYYVWDLHSFGDQLLIGTTYGTFVYRQGKAVLIKYYNATTADFYQSEFEENTIWQALDVGLAAIKWEEDQWVEKGEITGVSGAVREIIEVNRGELWLKTRSNGVFQVIIPFNKDSTLNFKDAELKHFDESLGIPIGENVLYNIHGEIFNRSENNDLSIFNRNTGRFELARGFAEKFGLESCCAFPKQNAKKKGSTWLDHYSQQGEALVYAAYQTGGRYRVKSYKTGKVFSRYQDPYNTEVFYGEENLAWIGGMNGIVLMQLAETNQHYDKFEVHIRRISDLQDSLLLMGAPSKGKNVNFDFNDNALRIEYAAPYYQKEGQNLYQYFLEGFDDQWSPWTTESKKDYTNLWEGTYNFKVRAKNNYGYISDIASFQFTVIPPWYRAWWAYVMYAIGLMVLIAGIVRWRSAKLKREKMQLEKLVMERTEEVRKQAEMLKELDTLKSRFFANISHEFRTPLTLILSPLQKLLATKSSEKENTIGIDLKIISLMKRNADRLLRLINQLLDLSKIEAGNKVLEVKRGDILQFVRNIACSFASLSEDKKINYEIQISTQKLEAYFDPEAIEKIIYNLLSNAFKFTNEHGKITFSLLIDSRPEINRDHHAQQITIIVKDAGKGMSPKVLERIFERFYQVDDTHTREQEGSGIGLALTKELVELHRGSIYVESEEGEGSTFTVSFPVDKLSFHVNEVAGPAVEGSSIASEKTNLSTATTLSEEVASHKEQQATETLEKQKPLVLLVEDSEDVRFFIKENLQQDYVISEAENGLDGLELALQIIPDVIITDLMMPKMDGIGLCKALKTNEITSHVPVIMLTARSNVETKLTGLQTGADDYLVKPFNMEELHVRITNLVVQRKKLRERFSREINFEPKEVTVNSVDERFLERVLSLVEQNLSDSAFGLPTIQLEVGMSKTQLHRKFKALTDQSPGEFIRNFRLKRAAQILTKQGGNVTEVAYQVGFNNLSYFAKCFKDFFGVSPSEYTNTRSTSHTNI